MSESDAHSDLVKLVAKALESRHPKVIFDIDLQEAPGDTVPPIINGFRPDVYARARQDYRLFIAEAKTGADLKTQRTYEQVLAFTEHLETMKNGHFTLAAWGNNANRAKTLLRFIRMKLQAVNTMFEVFDGCDFWGLDQEGGIKWHLI